jgi:hypothetical protein
LSKAIKNPLQTKVAYQSMIDAPFHASQPYYYRAAPGAAAGFRAALLADLPLARGVRRVVESAGAMPAGSARLFVSARCKKRVMLKA